MNETEKQLKAVIQDQLRFGCLCKNKSLGIKQMPHGYALMLDGDRTHYFWIRYDGCESVISWDKWQVWRWAKNDSLRGTVEVSDPLECLAMPYWYLFHYECCPVCGREERWKERKTGPKPPNRKDRYIETYMICHCEV